MLMEGRGKFTFYILKMFYVTIYVKIVKLMHLKYLNLYSFPSKSP